MSAVNWRGLRLSKGRAAFGTPANDALLRTVAERSCLNLPPVWMMRQAGRYLPEFRALRAENDFVKVCKDPELASEVTIQPWRRYAAGTLCEIAQSLPYSDVTSRDLLDAVIVFSDILTVPAALGQELAMIPGKGPVLSPPLLDDPSVPLPGLSVAEVDEQLSYVYDAIFATRSKLNSAVPVIGFSGAPYTLFGYMVEGGGSKTWAKTRTSFYRRVVIDPGFLRPLEDVIVQYLIGQYDAGADLLQLFDTNADELPAQDYRQYCLPGLRRIAQQVKKARPQALIAVFAKDYRGQGLGTALADVVDVIGVGWKDDIGQIAANIEREVLEMNAKGDLQTPVRMPVLQGNIDPAVLLTGDAHFIRAKVEEVRREMAGRPWIANLGHGMMPEMNPAMARMFLEAVKQSKL